MVSTSIIPGRCNLLLGLTANTSASMRVAAGLCLSIRFSASAYARAPMWGDRQLMLAGGGGFRQQT
jgi:hypothetical protein